MVDFKTLKNSRKKSLTQLAEEAKKTNSNFDNGEDDGKYWKVTRDKSGNGYAVIRFLPVGPSDDNLSAPWVKLYDHGFKNPANGKWYIEKSLTTLDKPDPLSEANSKLWNTGLEKNKKIARDRKRRLKYYSNIYVVKDSVNPENEGKVFLFSYGPKIFAKLQEAMEPSFEDEEPINPFDLWEGANFKIKVKTVRSEINGNKVDLPNYDDSSFDNVSPIAEDDKAIEAIWKQAHSLSELIDPSSFKTYQELKTRLLQVWPDGMDDSREEAPVAPPKKEKVAAAELEDSDEVPWSADDDDDDMSFFNKIAEDD